jgi:penicillin-binding protein 1A
MARAFAVFANQGRSVSPIAIRSVEDRNGRVVLDPERELRQQQRRLGEEIQVISPQNAYVMTSMLKKTVEMGTLYNPSGWGSKFTFKDENGKNFRMPMAGKTGTPQNWSDAWTVGFSPYYTTAIWFGFDKPGNSLGVNLTGSTLAGPVWADYMREIHQGLSYKDFARPAAGVIDVTVCAKSGLLKTAACNEGEITLPFLEGTQPSQYCNIHGNAAYSGAFYLDYMRSNTLGLNNDALLDSLPMPSLSLDVLPERPPSSSSRVLPRNSSLPNRRTAPGARVQPSPSRRVPGPGTGNRLLDGDDPLPPPVEPAPLVLPEPLELSEPLAPPPEPMALSDSPPEEAVGAVFEAVETGAAPGIPEEPPVEEPPPDNTADDEESYNPLFE